MAQLASRPPAQKAQPATPLPLSPHPRNPNSRPHPSPLPTPLSPLSIRSGSREHSRAPFDTNRRRLEVQSPEPPSRIPSASTTSPPVSVDRPRPPPHGSPPSLDAHVPLQTPVRPSASASPLPFLSSALTAPGRVEQLRTTRAPHLVCPRSSARGLPASPACAPRVGAAFPLPSPRLRPGAFAPHPAHARRMAAPLLLCEPLRLLCCSPLRARTAHRLARAPSRARPPWSSPLQLLLPPSRGVALRSLGRRRGRRRPRQRPRDARGCPPPFLSIWALAQSGANA